MTHEDRLAIKQKKKKMSLYLLNTERASSLDL